MFQIAISSIKSLLDSFSNLKNCYKSYLNYWHHELLFCKFENRLQSDNRRETEKNILKIVKSILSRAACVRQQSSSLRLSPAFAVSKNC